MYLVDTNVVSEARRGSPQAVGWMRSVDQSTIHLSVLTLGEIMRGIALRQNSDPTAAGHLAAWLRKIRHDHAARILPVTDQIDPASIMSVERQLHKGTSIAGPRTRRRRAEGATFRQAAPGTSTRTCCTVPVESQSLPSRSTVVSATTM